jgi:hypothetical protein
MGCGLAGWNAKNMELGVMYSMEANNSRDNIYTIRVTKPKPFYQGIAQQKQYDGSNYVDAINLEWFQQLAFQGSLRRLILGTGRFSGHWLTDVAANQKSMPLCTFEHLLTASFDATNDRVKVIANNIYIHCRS